LVKPDSVGPYKFPFVMAHLRFAGLTACAVLLDTKFRPHFLRRELDAPCETPANSNIRRMTECSEDDARVADALIAVYQVDLLS
jgi:hypothetical protein